MIHFITGKPGAGKGLRAMQAVLDELRFGNRSIITNLPVRLSAWVRGGVPQLGLREYLLKKYGTDFDCGRRVLVISDEDVRQFYLIRVDAEGNRVDLEANRDAKGRVVSFDSSAASRLPGVVYLMDELWQFFPSREWNETGPGLQYYTAQHRKFGDEVYFVTQAVKQVDVALARLAQDFTVMENRGLKRLGVFRQPDVFEARIYDAPPLNERMTAMNTAWFRLDKAGLGACYDTSAGVGIPGALRADGDQRKSGLNWKWALVGVGLFVAFLASVPKLFSASASRVLEAGVGKRNKGTNEVLNGSSAKTAATAGGGVGFVGAGSTNQVRVVPEHGRPYLFCSGVVTSQNRVVVWMSDGSRYTDRDGDLEEVTRDYVVIRSVRYPIGPPPAILGVAGVAGAARVR